jgi:Fibronectin type III domain
MTSAPLTQRGTPRGNFTARAVTLTWVAPTDNTNGTPLTDLAGYHIHYGTNPENLTKVIDLAGTSTTEYEVSGLAPGTYYFAISAYTTAGTESAESDVGYKTL